MPRRWESKVIVENDMLVNLKKLIKVGDGFAFLIPRDWVRLRCRPDKNGDYWVKMNFDGEAFEINGFFGEEQEDTLG